MRFINMARRCNFFNTRFLKSQTRCVFPHRKTVDLTASSAAVARSAHTRRECASYGTSDITVITLITARGTPRLMDECGGDVGGWRAPALLACSKGRPSPCPALPLKQRVRLSRVLEIETEPNMSGPAANLVRQQAHFLKQVILRVQG